MILSWNLFMNQWFLFFLSDCYAAIGQLQVLVSSAMSSFDSFSTASATYPVLQDCALDLCESKNDMTDSLDMVGNVMNHAWGFGSY